MNPFRVVTACAILLLGITSLVAAQQVGGNHVVLVSIDGLAAYHLEDEELELPNLRELVASGVWAEASESIFPSVTHPAHATLITGVSPRKHGVIGNTMTHRETGVSFAATTRTRQEAIYSPTIFDAASARGLTTAAFCWPETRNDPSVNYNILHGHGELDPAEVDPGLLETLRHGGVPIDLYYEWAEHGRMMQGVRDVILAQAAAEIIRLHQPELVAVHFLVTDGMQHAWGPDHYLSRAALTRADYALGLIREGLRDAGIEDHTTIMIVADHGFHSVYHESNIYPVVASSTVSDLVRLHGSGWHVFLETTEDFDEKRDGAALESLFEELLTVDGLYKIVRPEEFHSLGYPRYEESPFVRGQYMVVSNIDTYIVMDRSSNSTERRARTPSHSHGYLPDHPRMRPALILSGNRIREGIRVGLIRNVDVAPTIAEILGLNMPDVEGRVIDEAIRH